MICDNCKWMKIKPGVPNFHVKDSKHCLWPKKHRAKISQSVEDDPRVWDDDDWNDCPTFKPKKEVVK